MFLPSGEEVIIGEVKTIDEEAGKCEEYDSLLSLDALDFSITISCRPSRVLLREIRRVKNWQYRAIRRQKRQKEKERRKRLKG